MNGRRRRSPPSTSPTKPSVSYAGCFALDGRGASRAWSGGSDEGAAEAESLGSSMSSSVSGSSPGFASSSSSSVGSRRYWILLGPPCLFFGFRFV